MVPAPARAQKAEEIAQEKNRALKAAMNAELRKAKTAMVEETVPALEKLVKKGKGVTKERMEERVHKVRGAAGRGQAGPDDVRGLWQAWSWRSWAWGRLGGC